MKDVADVLDKTEAKTAAAEKAPVAAAAAKNPKPRKRK
jgi:hypothetical protein